MPAAKKKASKKKAAKKKTSTKGTATKKKASKKRAAKKRTPKKKAAKKKAGKRTPGETKVPEKSSGASPRISNDAVRARTGRGWVEWFRILDAAGAKTMRHAAAAHYLEHRHELPTWWAQMITVTYEQARKLRKPHERPTGFEISRTQTFAAPLATVYRAWSNRRQRDEWLGELDIRIRTATRNKSMRITWLDGRTVVDVAFTPVSSTRTRVRVQHGKLADDVAATKTKRYWALMLDELRELVEG